MAWCHLVLVSLEASIIGYWVPCLVFVLHPFIFLIARCHPILSILRRNIPSRIFETNTYTRANHHTLFYVFILYLRMAYSTVSTASNMKFPYKSPVVTSDSYQITLAVICKKAVHIIKANIQRVAHKFSYCPCHWSMASSITCCCGPDHQAVPLQISNVEYGPVIDVLLHDAPVFIVNWNQVETILWP